MRITVCSLWSQLVARPRLSGLSRLSVTQSVGQFLPLSVRPPLPRQSVSCRCSIYGIASPQLRQLKVLPGLGLRCVFLAKWFKRVSNTQKMPEPAPNANRMARNDERARALMQIARALNICRRVCEPLPEPPSPTYHHPSINSPSDKPLRRKGPSRVSHMRATANKGDEVYPH